ncbi:MAG: hypothetical protein WC376_02815 [Candidatus Nanoarchaeia archaeon]
MSSDGSVIIAGVYNGCLYKLDFSGFSACCGDDGAADIFNNGIYQCVGGVFSAI